MGMEDMSRKSRCLFLLFGLILLVLPAVGCVQGEKEPKARTLSGRVVLGDDPASGLAGVSLLVVDGKGSILETDAEGRFETAASEAVIIPRKAGFRFVPERQAAVEDQALEFADRKSVV